MAAQVWYESYNKKNDPRREEERRFARQIQEDYSAMANLPTQMIHQEYKSEFFGTPVMMKVILGEQ